MDALTCGRRSWQRSPVAENEVTLRVEAGKARGKHEGGDDDEPADLSGAPLFADLEQSGADKVDHVIVERLGPVREGNLGRFETDVTEEQIFARCGGGKYRLQCRTIKGKPIKAAFLTVEIAGEPIFQSELAQRMYDRQVGGMRRPAETAAAAPAMSPQDIVALLEQTRTSADAERERRAEAEEQRHNRELARIKAESDARAAERAAEDDRRRKFEEDRDERRRKEEEERRKRDKIDADEREERRAKAESDQRERDRQFQLSMAQLAKSSAPAADPIATLLAGVKLAQGFAGGGGGGDAPADPVTALVSNLPQTVSELGKMFRGQGGAAANDPNNLIITGELGKKGNAVIVHLQQQGLQPEALLNQAFDLLLGMRGTGTQPAQPAANVPPPRRGPGGRPITVQATTVQPAQPAQPAAQSAPAPAQAAQQTGTQPSVYPVVPPTPAGPA